MTVALVLDFPGATKQQYDQVVDGMELGGQMAPGGLVHVAGSYDGGWRVIDVWEDLEHFERFRDEQILPQITAAGMAPPSVRMIEVDEDGGGSGERPVLVQVVTLPGLDREAFHAADDEIVPGGEIPAEITFHVNGPIDGGWCVIDGWTSAEAHDRFIDSRVRPAMEKAPLQGPPTMEYLTVEATMSGRATART
jgi:quinol monooxygenase YgiN